MALVLFQNTFLEDEGPYLSGIPEWDSAASSAKEQALKTASEKLNYKPWAGQAVSADQPMSWPRTSFVYFDNTLNLVVTVETNTVPLRLERAVAQLALHFIKYPESLALYDSRFDSISVGPISVSNSNPDRDPGRVPQIPGSVEMLISPLLINNPGSGNLWWRAN